MGTEFFVSTSFLPGCGSEEWMNDWMTVLKKLLQIGRKLVIDSAEHIFSYDEINLQLSKVLWVNNSHKIKKIFMPLSSTFSFGYIFVNQTS